MKRLGSIISKHGKSCLIIKSEYQLDPNNLNHFLNTKVIDKNMDMIGKIVSVFGSKEQPYFLVYLFNKNSASKSLNLNVSGNKLYIKN